MTLTAEQIKILQLLINGLAIKQIAYRLQKTEGSVKVILFRARERAGVESNIQLVAFAVAAGLCNVEQIQRAPIVPADPGQASSVTTVTGRSFRL